MLIVHAHDQIAVKDIKLLTTVPSDGSTQSPYNRKQKQALQPQCYLLAGHTLCATGPWCSYLIWYRMDGRGMWTNTLINGNKSCLINYEQNDFLANPAGSCTTSSDCWPSGWETSEPRNDTPRLWSPDRAELTNQKAPWSVEYYNQHTTHNTHHWRFKRPKIIKTIIDYHWANHDVHA